MFSSLDTLRKISCIAPSNEHPNMLSTLDMETENTSYTCAFGCIYYCRSMLWCAVIHRIHRRHSIQSYNTFACIYKNSHEYNDALYFTLCVILDDNLQKHFHIFKTHTTSVLCIIPYRHSCSSNLCPLRNVSPERATPPHVSTLIKEKSVCMCVWHI